MTRTLSEAIKRLQQKPTFMGISIGVTRRRANNCLFLRAGEYHGRMHFCNCLVAGVVFFNCKASKEMEGILTKNRCKQSLLLQIRSSRFLSATILDFTKRGRRFLSFLIVNTHIVGIALGAPFLRRVQYSPRVFFSISVKAFNAVFFLPITV